MMTHILLNLPEKYQTIMEILKKRDKKDHTINIERTCDKLSVKFDRINKRPETKTSREDEKYLNIKPQYKGTCTTCRKYGHKGNTAGINKLQT